MTNERSWVTRSPSSPKASASRSHDVNELESSLGALLDRVDQSGPTEGFAVGFLSALGALLLGLAAALRPSTGGGGQTQQAQRLGKAVGTDRECHMGEVALLGATCAAPSPPVFVSPGSAPRWCHAAPGRVLACEARTQVSSKCGAKIPAGVTRRLLMKR